MSDTRDSEPPESAPPSPSARESRRKRLEGVIPEILKRAVERGVERAQEAPDNLKQFVGDLKLPKEIAHYLFSQIDETKNGLFRVVAKEIRDFLEHTNFAGEVQKLLTTVQFEVNTTIRFTPNDGRSKKESKKDAKGSKDEDATDEGPSSEGSAADDGGGGDDADGDGGPESERNPLPKPEVKTAVHVRRDDRERRRRSRSGT
jgi:hypothetical protein